MPIYCFDPRFYNEGVADFYMQRKTGIIRTRFQMEAVQELRKNLEDLGSCLLVAHDTPEKFV